MLFAATYLPNFLAQAALRNDPGLREKPSVVVDGKPPQVRVVALNSAAKEMGLWVGMTRADAEAQSCVQIRERSARLESLAHLALQDCLARFSPRCEDVAPDLFVLDISGLSTLMGTPAEIAGGMREQARNLALYIKVGVAGSIDSAIHAARAIKSPGPLFRDIEDETSNAPLERMTDEERLLADYQGTGMTTGPHPLFYSRSRLNGMGVTTAVRLRSVSNESRVTVAGFAITTQRPGTASGFLFISLEDETGIANAVVTPRLYGRYRPLLNRARFLLIEGKMQNLDGVRTVRAQIIQPLNVTGVSMASRSFR